MNIKVKAHKGHRGKSVYEWRVYRVLIGPITRNIQLGKFRTQEDAEAAANHYRNNDIRVAQGK